MLQEREFERLGSSRTLRTDARLIAATNRDLATLADEQKFRQDLFYRLNVFPITVPPLRERREDIPMLVRHFAQQFARRMKKNIETIPTETMEALSRYDWPGNIRELQNLIERAVILSTGPTLDVPLRRSTHAGRCRRLVPRRRQHPVGELKRSRRPTAGTSSPRSSARNWVIAGPERRRRATRHEAIDAAVPDAQARDHPAGTAGMRRPATSDVIRRTTCLFTYSIPAPGPNR